MEDKFETVISGVSGRFPDCENVPEFWTKLCARDSFMSTQHKSWPTNYRYKYTDTVLPSATGKLKNMREFDPVVFRMNNTLAECTDVMNRKILAPTFEAIMDAGLNPYELRGRRIGVYMAYDHNDSDIHSTFSDGWDGRFWVLGCSKTMMANRISFALDLRGPSFALTNDLFGNLTALNEAYKNVSEGHLEGAIVGLTAVAENPVFAVTLLKLNLINMDAITRVFDKNANGFGRSDAVVVLFIQRASDAKRVYASIDFCGYTYFGSNPNFFWDFNENLLKNSAIQLYKDRRDYEVVKDVSFVEMSACGLKNYDAVESNFIADFYCEDRKSPLLVGSVKSNVGHTEGAAPFVSLMKALLVLESGVIIENQNLLEINDDIRAFNDNRLQVVTNATTLPGDKILVNAVGVGGALSQVVLRRNPKAKKLQPVSKGMLPRLVLLCARTEDGIKKILRKVETTPFDAEFISLVNDVFSSDMPYHIFRGYTTVSADPSFENKSQSDTKGNKNRPIWFLFSGMGSQWNQMGKGLLELPIIAESVEKCHQILQPKGVDIYHILTTDDPTVFDNIMHSFVGIITIQIALVEVLKALGIKPDGIIGHSVGENACAYADGCLTLEQAVLSSYARGMASIETTTIKGMMAAVGRGYNQIKTVLPESIEVACHNSATSCTLSGPADDVEKYVKQLQEEKVFARAVNVANIAYHSKHIAPAAPNLLSRLQQIIPEPIKRSSKWISTSVPESDWDKQSAQYCSAEYLTNNLLNSVLFEEGCKHIPSDALVIEIAPHGLLQAIVKRSLPETCTNVALTRRNNEGKNIENLLDAIGRVYIAGCEVNVNSLYPPIEYPVSRETPSVASLATWLETQLDAGMFYFNPVGSHSGDPIVIQANSDSPYFYLKDHQIDNRIVLPMSFYLYLTWWVYCINRDITLGSHPVIFEDIKLLKSTTLSISKPRKFNVCIQKGSGRFEILKYNKSILAKPTRIMSGTIYQPDNVPEHVVNEEELQNVTHTISEEEFYRVYKDVGCQLNDTFRNITEMQYNDTDFYAKIKWRNNWVSFLDSLMKFSTVLQIKEESDLVYTHKIRKLEIRAEQFSSLEEGTTLLCHKEQHTNIITCNGLAMYTVKNKRFLFKKNQNTNISLQGLRFVSYQNPRCQDVAEFYKLCLHIAADNIGIMFKKPNAKLYLIVEDDDKHSNLLKRIVKNCCTMKTDVLLYGPKEASLNKFSLTNECCMLVTDNFRNIEKYGIGYSFILAAIFDDHSTPEKIRNEFVRVTEQRFADQGYHLFKKRSTYLEKPIRIEDDEWSAKCASNSNSSEVTFVVKRTTESNDLSLMFNNGRKPSDPRYMFVMDNKMPPTETSEGQQVLDLPISVFKNGEWGSYQNVSENLAEPDRNAGRKEDLPGNILLESIHLHYLSCDEEIEVENGSQIYGIEYSGVADNGERVMGLASVDSKDAMSKPDSILKWKIPTDWSLEDAITVPFIYSQAYRVLDSPAILDKLYLTSVLINVGDEGALCEACISISLSRKYTIYVTVSSHDEAVLLKKKFPQLDDGHIFNSQECSIQNEILRITKGVGVSTVVNCLSDIKSIQESMNCMRDFGFFFHIGITTTWKDDKLELYPFMKSVSFIPMQNKISSLLKLSADDKQNLKVFVEDGIKAGIVKSFERNVQIQGMPENTIECCENSHVKKIYKWFPNNEMNFMANQKIRYDNNRSYIIFGEKKTTSWFELIEWLISKGARKFISCVDNFALGPNISHRMNRLLAQKKTTIILSSSQKADNIQDAESLFYDANKIGPLEAVFFVSVASAGKKIDNMNLAARNYNSNAHFVSIFSGGLKECEARRFEGSPAVVIHGNKIPRKLSAILPQIDGILSQFDNSNSPTLYRFTNREIKTSDFPLRNYLPHDIGILESIADNISDTVEFVEVTTKAPRCSAVKDCSPVFIISPFGPGPLRGLLSNIMSPAFCASIGCCTDSAVKMASKLYESLKNIQTKGGVTLVSETWSSPIAIEILKLLERDARKYRLFTLDGNPLTWKRRVASLGQIGSSQFENNIIAHLLTLDPETRLENLFGVNKPLSEKISDYFTTFDHSYPSTDVRNIIIKVIQAIRTGLEMVSNYEYDNQLLKNTISIVKNHNDNELLNLSMTSKSYVHEEDDHFKFLSSPQVYNKINSNVMYSFWCD